MISAVIIVFAFVTSALTHPLTPQGQTTTGIEQTVGDNVKNTVQNVDSVIPNIPQVEKTQYQGVQQVYNQQQQQQQQPQPVETVGEKSGVQVSPETYPNSVNTPVQNGQEVYTHEKTSGAEPVRPVSTYVEQAVQAVQGVPESSITPVTSYVEKTGTPTEYSNVQQPVLLPVNPDTFPKQVEPVNVADPQQIVPVPITPEIQPLSVLPVPGGQIVNPIVVPTEGVTGRLIIMSVEPIQPRVLQPEVPNTSGTSESEVPQDVGYFPDHQVPKHGQTQNYVQQPIVQSEEPKTDETIRKEVPQDVGYFPIQQTQTQQQLYNAQPQPQTNVDPVVGYQKETHGPAFVPNQQQPLNYQPVVPQQAQIKTEQQSPYQQGQVDTTGYIPTPAQKIATHVPDHVPQNENPKQSLPNLSGQPLQQFQTYSCVPAQILSAVSPNVQVPSVKPVSNNPN